MTDKTEQFDPFLASDPPVLVHEASMAEFERAWKGADVQGDPERCPICRKGTPAEHGTGRNKRGWVRFSCGDVITQESTAG